MIKPEYEKRITFYGRIEFIVDDSGLANMNRIFTGLRVVMSSCRAHKCNGRGRTYRMICLYIDVRVKKYVSPVLSVFAGQL